jgi:hypothetical protein
MPVKPPLAMQELASVIRDYALQHWQAPAAEQGICAWSTGNASGQGRAVAKDREVPRVLVPVWRR